MRMPPRPEWEIIEDLRHNAYYSVCPPMNRKERRTARGQLLVAQGEAAALLAENEYLKEKLKGLEDA